MHNQWFTSLHVYAEVDKMLRKLFCNKLQKYSVKINLQLEIKHVYVTLKAQLFNLMIFFTFRLCKYHLDITSLASLISVHCLLLSK